MISKKVQIDLMYELTDLHHVVVQASDVNYQQIYALQLLHKQTDIAVFKADSVAKEANFKVDQPVLYLTASAGGHTQTWQNAGKAGYYFVGTKPKRTGSIAWTTQIARVNLKAEQHEFNSNTQLPRLAYLNRAGSGLENNKMAYPGKDLVRVEAAVSPDRQHFLIATIDCNHTGYFSLYSLAEVNENLDQAEPNGYVDIENLQCLGAFKVPALNSDLLHSIQGYDLDNDNNIFVSSQPSPVTNWLGWPKQGMPREIIKIPWGETNSDNWQVANLDQEKKLDIPGFLTEFEGIQAVDNNTVYLTVAYHRKNSSLTTLNNRVYKVTGFV